jgi:hypothetical protein
VVTILLLVVHVGLFGLGFFIIGMLVMITDSCAYQACGDPAWLTWANLVHLCAGFALLGADLLLATLRLGSHRVTFFVPLVCCVLEIGLCAAAIAMEAEAGPI